MCVGIDGESILWRRVRWDLESGFCLRGWSRALTQLHRASPGKVRLEVVASVFRRCQLW